MLTRLLVLTAAAAGLGSTGCSTMSNTEKGAGIGGLLGAGVGTAIGAATGNPKTGAVAGGLLGAGVGGLVGNDADRKDAERAEVTQAAAASAQQAQAQLGMSDVVRLTASGVDPDVIVGQIRDTGSSYQLSTGDIEYLTSARVDPRVIRAMQSARPRSAAPPRPIIVREAAPVYIERPVYVAPPPPVYIGGHYHRRW